MNAPRLLISGYYGLGNTGDEAILEAMVEELRRQRPGVQIRVLTQDPRRAEELGLEPLPRKRLLPLLRALAGTDLLISGGGGLVQDVTGIGSVIYYLGIVAAARLRGRPALLHCQGFGPVRSRPGRALCRALLPRATGVTVRDPESQRELEALSTPSLLAADPALLLSPPPPREMAALLEEEGLAGEVSRLEGPTGRLPGSGPLVAVCLREWPGAPMEEIAEALKDLAARERARLLVIPFQPDRDLKPSQALVQRLGRDARLLSRPRPPREILGLLGCVDLVVAMRLHALIFAASCHTPCLGLSYDPKVARFCARAGAPCLDLEAIDRARLGEALGHLLQGRAHLRRLLKERVDPMRTAARAATALALALAEGAGWDEGARRFQEAVGGTCPG